MIWLCVEEQHGENKSSSQCFAPEELKEIRGAVWGKSSSRQGHRSEDTREILAVQTIACRKLGVREHHVDNTRCNPSPRLDKRSGPVKSPGSLRFATGMCLVQREQSHGL